MDGMPTRGRSPRQEAEPQSGRTGASDLLTRPRRTAQADPRVAGPGPAREPGRAADLSHLRCALVAIVLVAGVAVAGVVYAHRLEAQNIHALAPELFQQKMQGSALQAEAFRQPDLLPLYCTSELDSFVGPYTASEFFRTYPTGFTVFSVGRQGMLPLIMLQNLAAVGSDPRGKKLAICASPTFFLGAGPVRENYYRGNFSTLHAGELALSSELSFDVKQAAARRMLAYPDTLRQDPLLTFILGRLADDSPLSRALYYGAFPLGKLQTVAFRVQDHWETLAYLRQRPDLSPEVTRQAARPDWASINAQAEREAERRADNNPFGFDAEYWERNGESLLKERGRSTDGGYRRILRDEMDWDDLPLLLRGLRDLGAEPLMLNVPLKGDFLDYSGVSFAARKEYYRQVHDVTRPYGVRLLDFAGFDGDKYFTVDRSHPSQEGWGYYDRALDAFYHGTLR
jgi:D-alanine transfer protein